MNLKSLTVATALLSFPSSSFSQSAPKYEAGQYQLDPAHSWITFTIPHLMISEATGQFKKVEGSLSLDKDWAKSAAKVSIDVASIDTGIKDRDEHLRSPDFFDVKKHPKMTFESTGFTALSGDKFQITGNLTLHGVTKPVTLDGKFKGFLPNDGYGNQKVGFKATTTINRKDFGLKYNQVVEGTSVVGDEVSVDLRVEFARPAPKIASGEEATKKK